MALCHRKCSKNIALYPNVFLKISLIEDRIMKHIFNTFSIFVLSCISVRMITWKVGIEIRQKSYVSFLLGMVNLHH
jgi:hypothetical protein